MVAASAATASHRIPLGLGRTNAGQLAKAATATTLRPLVTAAAPKLVRPASSSVRCIGIGLHRVRLHMSSEYTS